MIAVPTKEAPVYQHSTIRRQPPKPVYKPRNSGSAKGLEYGAVLCLSAIIVMPMFMSLATNLTHVFDTLGASIR